MTDERALSRETQAARALAEALKAITDDPETVRDTIEGETGLHEAIARVMASILYDETLVLGLDDMLETLEKRQHRLKERIGRKRAAIEQAMLIGELSTLELPDATLSLKHVPPSLEIVDEAKIPARFWKARDPSLDKSLLAKALKGGESVEGATLGNGSITLAVRRA